MPVRWGFGQGVDMRLALCWQLSRTDAAEQMALGALGLRLALGWPAGSLQLTHSS